MIHLDAVKLRLSTYESWEGSGNTPLVEQELNIKVEDVQDSLGYSIFQSGLLMVGVGQKLGQLRLTPVNFLSQK